MSAAIRGPSAGVASRWGGALITELLPLVATSGANGTLYAVDRGAGERVSVGAD
ncbi:MAG: hypothetical protein QOK16_821 [Solirubrobacteraceae bacterium]|nr:hypothetical protein [Solirubrobacteraceae bacterium]MEA2185810.1 hypothetical protein [Solirubrobacteraceae bacterium]